jgi:glutathione S-transferase
VPVLEHGGFVLYKTQAILRYLDRVLPDAPLTPPEPRAAARMDQVMAISDWYLFQNCGNIIGFQRLVGPALFGLVPDEAVIVEAMPRAHTVFAELSRLLGEAEWFSGAPFSLADLLVAPQLDFFSRTPEWGALTAERPNLIDWLERAEARPSLKATTLERAVALAKAAPEQPFRS